MQESWSLEAVSVIASRYRNTSYGHLSQCARVNAVKVDVPGTKRWGFKDVRAGRLFGWLPAYLSLKETTCTKCSKGRPTEVELVEELLVASRC
jgi:hypothetical protein